MHFLRVILRALSAFLFRTTVTLLPFVLAAVWLFGTPSHVESALRSSGVYDHFVSAVITQSVQNSTDPNAKSLLNDPNVQSAIEQSFTPEVLRDATEQATGGTYNWLAGKDSTIQFTIDFSRSRQKLADNLTAYALKRAQSLPNCTIAQLQNLPQNQDILTIPCLPPGVNPQQAASQFSKDTLDSANFLNNTTVTAANLPKNAAGQSFTTAYAWVPTVFHWLLLAPLLIGILATLSGIALIYLHDQRWRALKIIGWTFVSSAIFMLISVGLYALFADRFIHATNANMLGQLETSLIAAINQMVRLYMMYLLDISVAYVVAGVIVLVVAHKIKPTPLPPSNDQPNEANPIVATPVQAVSQESVKEKEQ